MITSPHITHSPLLPKLHRDHYSSQFEVPQPTISLNSATPAFVNLPIKTSEMSPQVPIPIPLASSSQTQIVPRIKDDDQLPDKAALRTLSSFIKTYRNSLDQSTTSIPISEEHIHTQQPSPLSQIHTLPQTPTTTTPPPPPPPPNLDPHLKMAHTTTTVTTKPSLLARLRGGKTHRRTYESNTHSTHHRKQRSTWGGRRRAGATAQPVHHHHRKPSVGDKISGALLKLRGSLTRRPGLKAAGTRRMRGTDGKGSHHTVAY
ncbi:hypothetical protein H4I95_11794 [Botrytis cinerea]